MHLIPTLALFGFTLLGCQPRDKANNQPPANSPLQVMYSKTIHDSLYVQTQLPLEYSDSTTKHFPVVVVLDGNFHFPMLAASIHQYEKAGLLPPLVLVGVGYKSFDAMDSLRVRDYLYPSALPADELKAPGGGEQFRQFLGQELLPLIDATYRTLAQNRTLLGHSFGGYFALYTLLSQAKSRTHVFQNFVAASPAVWYHNFYLNQLPSQLGRVNTSDSVRLVVTVGGQENRQWDVEPTTALLASLRQTNKVSLLGVVYNQLGHMDTGQLSFLKGLELFYGSR
ncbi:alpha/beta hydrolase [Spirosoma radiotolerans]|uniref:alpha/beta hydrolase n=1 Tax=Spirosoma radiotolerans TaxID=1379870 RepID=UPI0006982C67|nr:alpha/beta hydrolase-fold protein [Spirosoma radiotolerans]